MKKFTLSAIIILCAVFQLSADSETSRIISNAKQATALSDSLYAVGNIQAAIDNMEQFLAEFAKQPAEIRENMDYIPGWRNLYLSKFYAAAGDKEKALDRFCKAMEFGLVNDRNAYQWTMSSTFNIIKEEPRYKHYASIMFDKFDFRLVLKRCGEYKTDSKNFTFKYAEPSDTALIALRKHLKLDSVAGNGDELSKIKNLLSFVHNLITHDGSTPWAVKRPESTVEMVELCKQYNIGATCRQLAILLNECYLSMGIKSRYVTCMPKTYVSDCHVINSVWSNQLGKWIWVDPTYDAFVMDENDNLLGIAEVRERIRNSQPLKINDYANWNHENNVKKEYYLDYYMAKNLYFIQVGTYFGANMETGNTHPCEYIYLAPSGYDTDPEVKLYRAEGINFTTDPATFWQSPK